MLLFNIFHPIIVDGNHNCYFHMEYIICISSSILTIKLWYYVKQVLWGLVLTNIKKNRFFSTIIFVEGTPRNLVFDIFFFHWCSSYGSNHRDQIGVLQGSNFLDKKLFHHIIHNIYQYNDVFITEMELIWNLHSRRIVFFSFFNNKFTMLLKV